MLDKQAKGPQAKKRQRRARQTKVLSTAHKECNGRLALTWAPVVYVCTLALSHCKNKGGRLLKNLQSTHDEIQNVPGAAMHAKEAQAIHEELENHLGPCPELC